MGQVAPHAGAWIEIRETFGGTTDLESLPMRERGLKFDLDDQALAVVHVAPHAGAWIEIALPWLRTQQRTSLPMRERGLKYFIVVVTVARRLSLPMRERGLKSTGGESQFISQIVAPHAGAWIEIVSPRRKTRRTWSLPMRERGLKWFFAWNTMPRP